MSPNLARGKTELFMTPKGPKSNAWRKRLYGPTATGFFPIVGEAETYQGPVVSSYLHLGSLVHHSGETKQEAKRRVAIANASFNRHRKLVFQNPHIDIVKRTEMFNSLVMSKLSYAMETWTLPDWKSKEYIHAAILRLYRKLLKVDPDEHLSDDMLLTTLDLPSPTEVFRRARLRYVATLLQVGGSACWGLLNQDEAWISLIHDDLRWVWHLLENACDLGEPSAHIERWIEVMQFHRQYWKRLVRRACRHAILQRKKRFRCQQFYTDMKTILSTNDCWPVPLTQAQTLPKPTSEHTFGCMKCQRSFRSLGAREHTCSEPTKLWMQFDFCSIPRHVVDASKSTSRMARWRCTCFVLHHAGLIFSHTMFDITQYLDWHLVKIKKDIWGSTIVCPHCKHPAHKNPDHVTEIWIWCIGICMMQSWKLHLTFRMNGTLNPPWESWLAHFPLLGRVAWWPSGSYRLPSPRNLNLWVRYHLLMPTTAWGCSVTVKNGPSYKHLLLHNQTAWHRWRFWKSSFVRLQIMVSHRQMLSRGTLESTELCYMPSVADADWGTYESSWRSYRSNLLMGHCYMSYH